MSQDHRIRLGPSPAAPDPRLDADSPREVPLLGVRPAPAPPRALAALAWLWLAVALPFLTDAGCGFGPDLLLAVTWLLLYAAWLSVPLFEPQVVRSRAGRRWWLAAALPGLLGLVLAVTDLGLACRVRLCEAALAQYVAGVRPGTRELHAPRRVGLFLVDQTQEHGGAVLLYTSHAFLNRRGVAHLPPGTRPPSRVRGVRRLYGDWYTFEWKF